MPKKPSKRSAGKSGKSKRGLAEGEAAIKRSYGMLGDTSEMIRLLQEDHKLEDELFERKLRALKRR